MKETKFIPCTIADFFEFEDYLKDFVNVDLVLTGSLVFTQLFPIVDRISEDLDIHCIVDSMTIPKLYRVLKPFIISLPGQYPIDAWEMPRIDLCIQNHKINLWIHAKTIPAETVTLHYYTGSRILKYENTDSIFLAKAKCSREKDLLDWESYKRSFAPKPIEWVSKQINSLNLSIEDDDMEIYNLQHPTRIISIIQHPLKGKNLMTQVVESNYGKGLRIQLDGDIIFPEMHVYGLNPYYQYFSFAEYFLEQHPNLFELDITCDKVSFIKYEKDGDTFIRAIVE